MKIRFSGILVLVILLSSFIPLSAQLVWESVGPFGAYLTCVFNHDDTMYAGSSGGRLYKSTNGGRMWEQQTLDYTDGDVLTVWTYPPYVIATTARYRYRSTNAGQSWKRKAIEAGDASIPIVEMQERLYQGRSYSDDDGATWTDASANLPGRVLFTTKNTMFAEGDTLKRSTDKGATWKPVERLEENVVHMAGTNGMLYAITRGGRLCSSSDDGVRWSEMTSLQGITATSLAVDGDMVFVTDMEQGRIRVFGSSPEWNVGTVPSYVQCLYRSRLGGPMYAATRQGMFRSTDRGQTWARMNAGMPGVAFDALWNHEETLFAGFDASVFRSTDGGITWSDLAIPNAGGNGVVIAELGPLLTITTPTRDMFVSSDHGNTWNPWTTPRTDEPLFTPPIVHKGHWYVGGVRGRIHRAAPTDEQWAVYSTIATDASVWKVWFVGDVLVAQLSTGAMLRTTDGGLTWNDVVVGLPEGVAIQVVIVHGTEMYVGTAGYGVYVTSDGAATWAAINTGLPDGAGRITDMAFVRGTLYATVYPSSVYEYTPSGTWRDPSRHLADIETDLLMGCGDWLFISTNRHGLFRARLVAASVAENGGTTPVYPQPGTSYVQVDGRVCSGRVVVYASDGRSMAVECEPTPTGIRLDIRDLSPGVWLVAGSAHDDSGAAVRFVVK